MFTPKKTIGQLVAEAKKRIENVTIDQLKRELERGGIQLLDIRDVRERQKLGWIPGGRSVLAAGCPEGSWTRVGPAPMSDEGL
jgi:hypothetical protein